MWVEYIQYITNFPLPHLPKFRLLLHSAFPSLYLFLSRVLLISAFLTTNSEVRPSFKKKQKETTTKKNLKKKKKNPLQKDLFHLSRHSSMVTRVGL